MPVVVEMMGSANVQLLVLASVLVALGGLLYRWPALRGTTLRAPWCWQLGAVIALAMGSLFGALDATATWSEHVRYLAAVATLCPVVAVLGAKRPQDRGWQFIVASFWFVAALPALQQWFGRPNAGLNLHAAWQWFLLTLILISLFNSLPTRHWPGSLLAAVSQLALLTAHLPLPGIDWAPIGGDLKTWQLGVIGWCTAIGLWDVRIALRSPVRQPMDRLWLDFRDLVGTMWALRVADRMNAAAQQSGWNARLNWNGWSADSTFSPELERSLRMLLRRFVSPEWMNQRLAADRKPAACVAKQ